MASIYEFQWPVDQDGYEIRKELHLAPLPLTQLLFPPEEVELVYPRGGPPRYYRPMDKEHSGLWRRFAATCTSPDGVLSFARSFGLLNGRNDIPGGILVSRWDRLNGILGFARDLRGIAAALDAGERDQAISFYNVFEQVALLAPVVRTNPKTFKSELKFAPRSLASALLVQAGEAIVENRQFHPCRNEACPEWFLVGHGAATARKEFCSDRCRVAWARHHKQGSTANA